VDPRAGLDDVEKRKFLTLRGLELRPLGCPARSQSLYRLSYPGLVVYFHLVISDIGDNGYTVSSIRPLQREFTVCVYVCMQRCSETYLPVSCWVSASGRCATSKSLPVHVFCMRTSGKRHCSAFMVHCAYDNLKHG
jgi:hypothetical protein